MTEHTMVPAELEAWSKVEGFLAAADSVAYDGCHKIYVLADPEGTATQRGWGYGDGSDDSQLLMIADLTNPLDTVQQWFYEDSCGLRFVNGIKGTGEENEHYVRLIGQGDESDWYPDEDDPYWSRV
jgi:hypothetical protein